MAILSSWTAQSYWIYTHWAMAEVGVAIKFNAGRSGEEIHLNEG